jgi:glycosyltransferase involved in cell wall biosynthesis
MKFSIVVPSYNQGVFLQRTLDSIVNQKGVEFEVLVFDGGSKDQSVDVLERQVAPVKWISQKDRGQTDAINQGLHQATGEIVAYLNSDDVYYPDTLKRVFEYFTNNPDAQILYGNGNHIDENDKLLEPYYNEPWNFDRLIDICFICQPAVFWRRSILERFGYFDDNLQYAMDYDYWLRVGREIPMHYLTGAPLAGSRMYSDNKTLSKRLAVHAEILKVVHLHAYRPPYRWLKTLAHIHVEEDLKLKKVNKRAVTVVSYIEQVIRYANEYNIPLNEAECNDLVKQLASVGL